MSGAYLDPCIEIGDTIRVTDRSTTRTLIVASANIKCTSSYNADLAYQVDVGDEDEYPYVGATKRMENRIRDSVKRGEINAMFATYVNSEEGKANMTAALSGSFATAESLTEISQSITGVESKISLSASYDDNSIGSNVRALLELVANPNSSEIQIKADKINFDGFTTFVRNSDLSESGKTTINGGNITTGTISAERIDVSKLKVSKIYSGSYTAMYALGNEIYIGGAYGDLNFSKIYLYSEYTVVGTLTSLYRLTFDALTNVISGGAGVWEIGKNSDGFSALYLSPKYSAGSTAKLTAVQYGTANYELAVNGSRVLTVDDSLDKLTYGSNYVQLESSSFHPSARDSFSLGTDSYYWSGIFAKELSLYYSSTKSVKLACNSSGGLTIGGSVFGSSLSSLIPSSNDTYNLGSSSKFWSNLYAKSLRICYSTSTYLTLTCSANGNSLLVNGTAFSPSALNSGTSYSISLESKVLTPAANDTYDLGSSSKFWSNAYIKSLKLCYSTSTSVTLACSYDGKLTVGGTTFDPSSSGSVSQLKSGSYDVELSSSSLLPGSSNSYNLGSSSYFWNYLYVKTVRLYYGNYGSYYVDLTCNSSGKLLAGGKLVTTA